MAREGRPAGRTRVRGHVKGAAVSIFLALAWLALSWWHPALTYHFGPPLAAAAWPFVLRAWLRRPARRAIALTAVFGGFAIAMAALGVAIAAHWLRGPTLIRLGSVPPHEGVPAGRGCRKPQARRGGCRDGTRSAARAPTGCSPSATWPAPPATTPVTPTRCGSTARTPSPRYGRRWACCAISGGRGRTPS